MTLRLNGSTSGYVEIDAPAVAGSNTLTLPTGNGSADQVLSTNGSGALSFVDRGRMVLETAKATTSGTSVDFTGIPSWVKRVTVMFNGVSTNGTSNHRLQIGSGGTPATSGYSGVTTWTASSSAATALSAGFDINANSSATTATTGVIILINISGNTWVASGVTASTAGTSATQHVAGVISLSGVLNIVRFTSVTPDTFDAGSINILYEG
jgi:hypothetical protein